MNKKTVRDIDLAGKRVIMRVDFNVPHKAGVITDDTRIRAALPTITYILEHGASLVLMSHMGRPEENGYEEKYTLKPVATYLAKLLGKPVAMAADCRGPEVAAQASALAAGDILLLENTRFHAAEQGKKASKEEQAAMAKELAALGDVFVMDAFGASHRAHASTSVIADYAKESVAGLLLEKELQYLGGAIANPARPFVAIIGGAKISGKLEVTLSLIKKVDTIIIGGGMAYTFKKAQGFTIGDSIHEDDLLETAKQILADAKAAGVNLLLPIDNIVADGFSETANTQIATDNIPDGWEGLDIGPASIKLFEDAIKGAKTVIWNGPLGCFEMAPFAKGTMAICQAVADSDSVSIIGGGDSVSAVNKSGLADKMSHISTGGGASLEFLEGKILPGVACLNDK